MPYILINKKKDLTRCSCKILQGITQQLVYYLSNMTYNIYMPGLVSKFDDYVGTVDDLEYKANRWDDIADKIEDLDVEEVAYQHHINGLKDKLDKIQELDDRLTELLAGYKLDVQLVKEEF